MPARTSTIFGAPCWVDLMTTDPERAVAFYRELLGWQAEDANEEFGGYRNFTHAGERIAGCMGAQPEAPDSVWSVYLASDDIDKTLEAVSANGGQVLVPAMAVADLGSMAVVLDPTGATVGVWQPGTHTGFGHLAEPGAPSWFELMTRDHDGALAFYRAAFGWDTQSLEESEGITYSTLVVDGEWLAGVMDASAVLAEGTQPHWSVYFGVDDTDAAVTKVEALGGSVLEAAEDSPYGRIATVADPTGAIFHVVAANEEMPAKG